MASLPPAVPIPSEVPNPSNPAAASEIDPIFPALKQMTQPMTANGVAIQVDDNSCNFLASNNQQVKTFTVQIGTTTTIQNRKKLFDVIGIKLIESRLMYDGAALETDKSAIYFKIDIRCLNVDHIFFAEYAILKSSFNDFDNLIVFDNTTTTVNIPLDRGEWLYDKNYLYLILPFDQRILSFTSVGTITYITTLVPFYFQYTEKSNC